MCECICSKEELVSGSRTSGDAQYSAFVDEQMQDQGWTGSGMHKVRNGEE